MGNDWKKVFEKPGKEYRSAPFWAWNEKINEQESKFQIQEMSDKGMGGFFIHSREGLETSYLSEGWMEQVDVAVREAKEKDIRRTRDGGGGRTGCGRNGRGARS